MCSFIIKNCCTINQWIEWVHIPLHLKTIIFIIHKQATAATKLKSEVHENIQDDTDKVIFFIRIIFKIPESLIP